ncbi:MAG TPA: protease pro-enzyme activation domain-containing protein, partial [Candidatus Binataceae bacterium]
MERHHSDQSNFAKRRVTRQEHGRWLPRYVLAVALAVLLLYGATAHDALSNQPPLLGYEATPSDHSGVVRIPGHVLPALHKATRIDSSARNVAAQALQPIELTIVLKRDRQTAFEQYLRALYDRHSPQYRKFLSQSEVADRFGPSRATYDAALGYLRAHGFTMVRGSANRLTLTVRGTRAQAEQTFGVAIRDYKIGQRSFYANDAEPSLPASLAMHVQAVAGLSDLQQPHHAINAISAIVCNIQAVNCGKSDFSVDLCYKDITKGTTYNTVSGCSVNPIASGTVLGGRRALVAPAAASVPWKGVDGTGQTIGLVEFDTFDQSNIVNYLALSGLPATLINQLSAVPVDGGVSTPGADQNEVLLDINATLSLAPGAKTVVYDAPFGGAGASFQDVFNKMISDKVSIISNSWAYCEDQTTLADVESIDSILQSAATAGISVFNGSGDTGSGCLDGSANTVAVPADSPNATAVGGSSEDAGPLFTYGPETWWDDSATTPPAGQGGFGQSKYFNKPSYQNGFASGTARSVPDVVVDADPFHGVYLCNDSDGGCPNGLTYAGTSLAAPVWAAFAALLNQGQGSNLGFLNPQLYNLSGTAAFHDPASLNSDFDHVGLGSPNVNALYLQLTGQSAGPADATQSNMQYGLPTPATGSVPGGIFDDGTTAGTITVWLVDANGNAVSGKSVKLSASGGSATITPASVTSTADNGSATFKITDAVAENLQITAQDTTDGVTLATPLSVSFVNAPATSAGIGAVPSSVTADGVSTATITITLEDGLGRPAPGKLISLSQTGGSSVISGPNPPVTNASGQVIFTASDTNNETVTYSAVDVTDLNLPFPQTSQVTFSSAVVSGCGVGTPTPAPGYVITPIATGFQAQNVSAGDISFGAVVGCPGAGMPAFDASGNIYASDFVDGDLYKFPSTGGVAGPGTRLASIGQTLAQAVFSGSNLWVVRAVTGSGVSPAGFYEVDTTSGTIINSFTSLFCSANLAADSLTGDLFSANVCGGDPALYFSNLTGSPPTFAAYGTMPSTNPGNISFLPGGTFYIEGGFGGSNPFVAEVSGTNVSPTTVTQLPGLQPSNGGIVALGTGNTAQALVLNLPGGTGPGGQTTLVDVTTNPPTIVAPLTVNSVLGNGVVAGPDGCLYGNLSNAIYRLSKADGTCPFVTATQPPTLTLTPVTASPNPAQGSSQSFVATVHYATVPAGTPVTIQVQGANLQKILATTNASGQANFSYVGSHTGNDILTGTATISSTPVTSNPASVTWGAGQDVTSLALNTSPTSGVTGQTINVSASLIDSSQNPFTAVAGETINFTIGGGGCAASTNSSGVASCGITVAGTGSQTLSASFAGTGQLIGADAAVGFTVLTPPSPTPTPTPPPTPTPTPTATPTPVVGTDFSANFERLRGKAGDQVSTSFSAANNTGAYETISSVTLDLSDPQLLSALSVSANEQTGEAAGPIGDSNQFTFDP